MNKKTITEYVGYAVGVSIIYFMLGLMAYNPTVRMLDAQCVPHSKVGSVAWFATWPVRLINAATSDQTC